MGANFVMIMLGFIFNLILLVLVLRGLGGLVISWIMRSQYRHIIDDILRAAEDAVSRAEKNTSNRARSAGYNNDTGRRMSRSEALKMFGLGNDASEDQIKTAYFALMKKLHPDLNGGSDYFSRQVIEAKEVLIGK